MSEQFRERREIVFGPFAYNRFNSLKVNFKDGERETDAHLIKSALRKEDFFGKYEHTDRIVIEPRGDLSLIIPDGGKVYGVLVEDITTNPDYSAQRAVLLQETRAKTLMQRVDDAIIGFADFLIGGRKSIFVDFVGEDSSHYLQELKQRGEYPTIGQLLRASFAKEQFFRGHLKTPEATVSVYDAEGEKKTTVALADLFPDDFFERLDPVSLKGRIFRPNTFTILK